MHMKHFLVPMIVLFAIMVGVTHVHAQYDEEKAFAFLQQIYKQHEKKLNAFTFSEMEHFLLTFPQSPHAPEVLILLAKANEATGDKSAALALYLKALFLYPEDEKANEARELVRQLIGNERRFAEQRTFLLNSIGSPATADSGANRFYTYLETIMPVRESHFNPYVLSALREFTLHFPTDARNEQVQIWIGETYAQNDENREADLSYAKFIALFPESQNMAEVLYRRGTLQYQKLKQNDDAIATLARIKSEFPESQFAPEALILSGEIKKEKKKDFQGAIADYRFVVDDYPQSSQKIEALWNIAKINKDNLKEYPTAILAFNNIIEADTSNQKAVLSLEEIADIYENKMKDYEQAAATFFSIAEKYPDYAKAPDRLMDAGVIYESKLNHTEKAMNCYQKIVDTYSEHKKAKEAAKKIDRLKQKAAPADPGSNN
ncbi:MAG: tetratricopeptide repeat protein [Candidatus Zhuqueibacterota bacterium]